MARTQRPHGYPLSRRLNRRRVGRLGVGGVTSLSAGMLLRVVRAQGVSSVRAEVVPVDSPFASSYPTTDAKLQATLKNVITFVDHVDAQALIGISEAVGAEVVSRGTIYPVPIVRPAMGLDFHLTRDGEPFPNLTTVLPLDSQTYPSGLESQICNIQGIPLGRLEYPFEYTNQHGETIPGVHDVGLLGVFAGDPASRGVVAVTLGFRTNDVATSGVEELKVRQPDAGPYQIIIGAGQARGTPQPSSELARAWDEAIGSSSVFIVAGYPEEPQDYSDLWASRGLPAEYASLDYIVAVSANAKTTYMAMLRFALTRAVQDGYVAVADNYGAVPIPELFPDVQPLPDDSAYEQHLDGLRKAMLPILGDIPDEGRQGAAYLDLVTRTFTQETLTPDMSASILNASTFVFSPISSSVL
jgi:hypothetical protein